MASDLDRIFSSLYFERLRIPSAVGTPEEIVGKLRAIRDTNTELSVTISGDAGAEYGRVIGLMALLKEAGFDKVGLKTEAKPLGKKK